MVEVEVTREGDKLTARGPRGSAILDMSSKKVVRITYVGVAHGEFATLLGAELSAHGRHPITMLLDASQMATYTTSFRKGWAEWLEQHEPERVLILFRSRIVSMGVAMTNAVIRGNMESFSDRESFEAAATQLIAAAG